MNTVQKECGGKLKVSEDVVMGIASNVISEYNGVSEHRHGSIFGKNSGITVSFEGGAAKISASVDVEYGTNAMSCAETLQTRIKSAVQDMTGVMVKKVDIKVVDLK